MNLCSNSPCSACLSHWKVHAPVWDNAERLFQTALHLDHSGSFFWMKRAADAGHELARDILSEHRSDKAQSIFMCYFSSSRDLQPTEEELVLCSPYMYYQAAWGNDFANDPKRLAFLERGAESGCLRSLDDICHWDRHCPLLHPMEYYEHMIEKDINWPYFLANLIQDNLAPHIWAKRVKMMEDWLGDLDWIDLHEEDWDGLIRKVTSHQAYFLGKFGCQFRGHMYSYGLKTQGHAAYHWFVIHYTRFTAAMTTAALHFRRILIPRDVRRLILWQCREVDWIPQGEYWK